MRVLRKHWFQISFSTSYLSTWLTSTQQGIFGIFDMTVGKPETHISSWKYHTVIYQASCTFLLEFLSRATSEKMHELKKWKHFAITWINLHAKALHVTCKVPCKMYWHWEESGASRYVRLNKVLKLWRFEENGNCIRKPDLFLIQGWGLQDSLSFVLMR